MHKGTNVDVSLDSDDESSRYAELIAVVIDRPDTMGGLADRTDHPEQRRGTQAVLSDVAPLVLEALQCLCSKGES